MPIFTMKPQEVKLQAQTDWLGFCKGVRTYVQCTACLFDYVIVGSGRKGKTYRLE